jgi:hypothetical protein
MLLKITLSALALTTLMLSPAKSLLAEEQSGGISAAAVGQLDLANKLVALGDARHDPILLIAAVKLYKGLSDDPVGVSAESHEQAKILERAKSMSNGRADITGLVEDMKAAGSRGCSVRYGCQNPYTR